jgi:imidazoleglycerol-phosphate dehydratase
MAIMVKGNTRRTRKGMPPKGFISLALRAEELSLTVASLRRYVKLGRVRGQVARTGNRIYVARDLTPVRARQQRKSLVPMGRVGSLTRETSETRVVVQVGLDGRGHQYIATGNGMLDHLLQQIARHGLIDLTVEARGDGLPDGHHLVEDVAITLGRAIREAVGDGKGIRRMGSALVPLDEALAQVAVDFGGRGYAAVDTPSYGSHENGLDGSLVTHFFERLALEGNFNLHARLLAGTDPHHVAEALFKALARAMRYALERDPRVFDQVPSTKGTISG